MIDSPIDSYEVGRILVLVERRGYETPCHVWQGHRNNCGYGTRTINKKRMLAHRAAYRGPIPQGFDVHHKCETRACVNPDHLELVSGERDHKQKHGFTLTERVLQMVEARPGPVRACDLAYWADASSDTVSTILHRGVQYGRLERVARGFFVAVRDREGS